VVSVSTENALPNSAGYFFRYGDFSLSLIKLENLYSPTTFGMFFRDLTIKPPKDTSFAGNSRFGIQIVKTGQEMRLWRVKKQKRLKLIQIETRRSYDVISHINFSRRRPWRCKSTSGLVFVM